MKGNHRKTFAACKVSKNVALPQVFFCHVLILFKVSSVSFCKSPWYHSNSCMLLYTKWKIHTSTQATSPWYHSNSCMLLYTKWKIHTSTQATSEYIKCKHWMCRKTKAAVFFMWLASRSFFNFIILILICFYLIIPGLNYLICCCSSARTTPGVSLHWNLTL